MKLCHVCKAECGDNAELCPVCGADLTAEIEKDNDDMSQPVLLARVDDIVAAEILMDMLSEAAIPYSTGSEGEDIAVKVCFGGGFCAQEIFVDAADFEEAEKIYEEFLKVEAESEEGFLDDDFEFEADENAF